MRYIGIDPGKGGGIAVLGITGKVLLTAKMPDTNPELLELLRQCGDDTGADEPGVYCVLEFVRSMPGQGHVGAFTFGRGLGTIEMGLAAVGVPYDDVTPQRWQAALGCMSKGKKNVTKARAMKLFPNYQRMYRITHAIADAMLLAEYCRRFHLGLLPRSVTQRKAKR